MAKRIQNNIDILVSFISTVVVYSSEHTVLTKPRDTKHTKCIYYLLPVTRSRIVQEEEGAEEQCLVC